MDVGLFIPIGNNGWLISTTSPQYKPSFDLNRVLVQEAEAYGFDFALSMIKLHGFGGPSQFWDYNLESFTLMAGLAAVTSRIKLFASVAVLTIPPAIVARMAVTIDSISHGRFGINIVSGWQKREYEQMGLWPGLEHFERRYEYCSEYVQIMRDLWSQGRSDLKGDFFQMDDCRLLPLPDGDIKILCAGQSDTGMAFAAKYGDFCFVNGVGINTPTACSSVTQRVARAAEKTGRPLGTQALFMIIADETEGAARKKWQTYQDGADTEALAWMGAQSGADTKASAESIAVTMNRPEGAINFNMGTLIGSFEQIAEMLDEAATIPNLSGVMLTFDDFPAGLEQFGQRIQPLMKSRRHIAKPSRED
jgi:pyrimidine oxygenase